MAENNKKAQVKLRQIKTSDVKNDGLKNALVALKAEKSKENEIKMFAELKKAHMLVPAIFQGESAKTMQIKFVLVNTADGKSYFPAFTDEEEAKKLAVPDGEARQYIIRSINELSLLFNDANNQALGVVVNPMSANIVLPKESVIALAKAPNPQPAQQAAPQKTNVIPAGTKMTFSEPRIYPTALVNAVHDGCKELEGVSRVWFKQFMSGNQVGFALIVDGETVDQALLEKVHDIAVPFAKDVPVYAMQYNEQLEKIAIQGAFPLYDKELDI